MDSKGKRWLAVATFLVSVGLLVAAVVTATSVTRSFDGLAIGLLVIVFPAIGSVIVANTPGNRIGWIYLVSGLLGGVYIFLLVTAETWKLIGRDGWNVLDETVKPGAVGIWVRGIDD